MKNLHIDPKNRADLEPFKAAIRAGKPVFVLVYMEGCGPCNATRPEWAKLKNADLKGDIVIADIDRTLLEDLAIPKLANIQGFPSMKYIKGDIMEDYEGGRTIDDFVRWIRSKQHGGGRRHRTRHRHRRHRHTKHCRQRCRRQRHTRHRRQRGGGPKRTYSETAPYQLSNYETRINNMRELRANLYEHLNDSKLNFEDKKAIWQRLYKLDQQIKNLQRLKPNPSTTTTTTNEYDELMRGPLIESPQPYTDEYDELMRGPFIDSPPR